MALGYPWVSSGVCLVKEKSVYSNIFFILRSGVEKEEELIKQGERRFNLKLIWLKS